MKVLLRKYKEHGHIEFDPVYCNSTTKTIINFEYDLVKSFQEILYRIDNWINEGSCWESINGEYVNISIYSPLSERSCIELPENLRNSKKDLINNKCFL